MSSTNAMNFGPAWMRTEARSKLPVAAGVGGEQDGRNSPHVTSNGSTLSSPPPSDPSLSLGINGANPALPQQAQSNQSTNDPATGNGTTNHDKPFKYTRDEMLNIWKNNSQKIKSNGIPLEFEKHDIFTSNDTLDPVLLTEMTSAEKEAFAASVNSEKADTPVGRGERGGRFASPRTERSQSGLSATPGRGGASTRGRTPSSSRVDSAGSPFSTGRPQIRSVKSREYFTGVFGGSNFGGGSPPEKDIWGSATKKGSFDEHGKFVVSDDNEVPAEPLEMERTEDQQVTTVTRDEVVPEPPSEIFDSLPQEPDSFSTLSDNFSSGGLQAASGGFPSVAGRSTSRFSSFAVPDEPAPIPGESPNPLPPVSQNKGFQDDQDDLNDILSMAADPRAMSPPRPSQIDRLTSRFAAQSLNPEPSGYSSFGGFEADTLRRESQFFPGQPGPSAPPVSAGLFEHPVVPQQPALPPAPPQTTRVMIMADKLKWVYKDPQGNVQGPFTGLEMHDWYRGGYFHPNLEVRREDDRMFEPLHSLVKRIGNQREPFLVPLPSKTQTQVIPPRSTTTLSGWNTTLFGEPKETENPWGGVPPPITPTALPGTTLTADQQNALERRKQEEQYLLVRQRELAAAAVVQQVPPLVPPVPHHLPPAPGHPYMPAPPFGGHVPMRMPVGITHHVHTGAPVQVQTLPPLDTLRTSSSPAQTPQSHPPREQSPMERYPQQTRQFMSPWGAGTMGPLSPGNMPSQAQDFNVPQQFDEPPPPTQEKIESPMLEGLVEKAEIVPEPVPEEIAPETFKSSISGEPVSPQLDAAVPVEEVSTDIANEVVEESSPVLVTPAPPTRVAPWATPQKKDEQRKSPLSLKQIQELETKKAAEQARILAAQREAATQKALATAQAQAAATMQASQPALSQGSTWGSIAAKGWNAKTTASSPGKKTMAEIQKEEEQERARLAKGKEASGVPTVRGYASAAAVVTQKPVASTAWTTVGPGGRPGRPVNGGASSNTPAVAPPARAVPVRSISMEQKPGPTPVKPSPPQNAAAVEDFQKWCRSQLKSLSGVNSDEIYQMMIQLPPNESTSKEIISDTIYTHSPTMDGRHFADEFLKRRKALGPALEATISSGTLSSGTPSNSGSGWNEVLKKEKKDQSGEWNSAFKVVAGKKGRRRG